MDVLRKEEEEEAVEEEVSSSPIHVDIWDLFDRYSKKSNKISQEALEEADEALQVFLDTKPAEDHRPEGDERVYPTFGQLLDVKNIFREPFRTGKVNLNAIDASEEARERFVKDMETFARKVEKFYNLVYDQASQDDDEISDKYWRQSKPLKDMFAKLFGEELVLQTRVRRRQSGKRGGKKIDGVHVGPREYGEEEEYTAVSTKKVGGSKNGVLDKLLMTLRTPASPIAESSKTLQTLMTNVAKHGTNDSRSKQLMKKLHKNNFFDRKTSSKIQEFLYNGKSLPKHVRRLLIEEGAEWEGEDWNQYRMYGGKPSKELMIDILTSQGIGRTNVEGGKELRSKLTRYASMDVDSMMEKAEGIMYDGEGKAFHYLFEEDYADDILFAIYRMSAKLETLFTRMKEHRKDIGKKTKLVRNIPDEAYVKPIYDEVNRVLRFLHFLLTVNKITGQSHRLKKQRLEVVKKIQKMGSRSRGDNKLQFEQFNIDAIDVSEGSSPFRNMIAAFDAYKPSKQSRKITIGGKKFEEGTDKQEVMDSLVDDIEKLKARLSRSKKKATIEAREKEIATIYRTIDSLKPKLAELKESEEPNVQRKKKKLVEYIKRIVNDHIPKIEQSVKNNEEMLERLKRNNPVEYKYRKKEAEEKIYALTHQVKLTRKFLGEIAGSMS
jgi:hypothetical protein